MPDQQQKRGRGRPRLGEETLTPSERQARRMAKLLTFRPLDKPALEAAAAQIGKDPRDLVAEVVAAWLDGAVVAPPPPDPDQVVAAQALDARRRVMLQQLADVLATADDDQLDRVGRRLAIIADSVRR